jgi:hypothetical protein
MGTYLTAASFTSIVSDRKWISYLVNIYIFKCPF